MKTTARFDVIRAKTLRTLFTPRNLKEVWRKVVRNQLRRNIIIMDLHDYYDFNFNIEKRAAEICHQVLGGNYKASNPLVYKTEKKFGICRHLMLPGPGDALVLQTIIEHIAAPLISSQPTSKAYYSRDKHNLRAPNRPVESKGYPWFALWPKFQRDIKIFAEKHPYLVVTDLTNYYDNIGLRELRHVITSRMGLEEVVVDVLFNIIEQLCWRPDYLPTTLTGLPTINLEAFRLLPHTFLFEIDEVLSEKTDGQFVRWMDDINFGVDSLDKAYTILGEINEVLKSRGLALNLGKTTIYTSGEATKHFMFEENEYLDRFKKIKPDTEEVKSCGKELLQSFKKHLRKGELRNWDKITKRYLSVAGRLKLDSMLPHAEKLYRENPSLRDSVLYYFHNLGYSSTVLSTIEALASSVKRYDDVTLYKFCQLLTDMSLPRSDDIRRYVSSIEKILKKGKTDFDLYAHFWFAAKFYSPEAILVLIKESKALWRNEPFLARQVMAIVPRIYQHSPKVALKLLNEQMIGGARDAASVASNIHDLLHTNKLSKRLQLYLLPESPAKKYSLEKFLILMAVLSSDELLDSEKRKIHENAEHVLSDPWYSHWINGVLS